MKNLFIKPFRVLFFLFVLLLVGTQLTYAQSGYNTTVLADNPVSYWRLGETSGTVMRDERAARNGTYVSSPLLGQPGAIIGDTTTSVQLNGTSSYASVPYAAALNTTTFSIEAWAYPTGGNDYRAVVSSRNYPNGWVIYAQSPTNGNNWSFWLSNGTAMEQVNGPVVELNKWAHVVGTFNGSTAKFYVNGQLVATKTISGYKANTNGPFLIGKAQSSQNYLFPGRVDEVAYYASVLTDAKILSHYQKGISANVSPTPTPTSTPTSTPSPTVTPTPTATPTPTQTQNLVLNSSMETVSAGDSTLPANWSKGGYGTNTRTLTYLTNEGHTGSRSVRTDITSYQDGDSKWYPAAINVIPGQTIEISDYYKSNAQSQVYVQFNLAGGGVQYVGLPYLGSASDWTLFKGSVVVPTNAQSMLIFHSLLGVGYLTIDDMKASVQTNTGFNRGIVSITFDDGWVSEYNNGYPVLTSRGLPATFYIITSWLGQSGAMTSANVQTLYNSGHEIGSHTVTHPHLSQLISSQIASELSESQQYLQNLLGTPIVSFASPFGDYNSAVLSETALLYTSHRTSDFGFNTKANLSPNVLKVQYSMQGVTPAQIQTWVDQAKTENLWLILVYHDIDTSGNTYATSPLDLAAHMDIIKNSGIKVSTVKDALAEVKPQAGL